MASRSRSSVGLLRRSGTSIRQAWLRSEPGTRYQAIIPRRFMATEAPLPSSSQTSEENAAHVKIFANPTRPSRTKREQLLEPSPVIATIYTFPNLEPVRFKQYNSKFLHLPLRRDILHRAVVYEGHAHRLGRAKTKWRSEIVASKRKLRPQKGSGRARVGDASSPMLKGGAKAHGPKPRDFRTALPKKVYDLAFRTALSHRYRKGELVIIGGSILPESSKTRYIRQILLLNKWGKGDGKTLFITMSKRNNLFAGLNMLGHHGRAMAVDDVDVKDLLEMGRIVIEEHALEWIGEQHGITFGRPLRTIERPRSFKSGSLSSTLPAISVAPTEVVDEVSIVGSAMAATTLSEVAEIEAAEEQASTTISSEESGELVSESATAVVSDGSQVQPEPAPESSTATTTAPPAHSQ